MNDTIISAPGATAAGEVSTGLSPMQSYNPFIFDWQPATGRPEVTMNMNLGNTSIATNFMSREAQRAIADIADRRIDAYEQRTSRHMINVVESSYSLR